ncbi:MAG: class II fructose-bisphosphate aldolase [Gallionella sp.]
MPLVNMKDMLQHAYRNGYAVGAFDLPSLDFLEAIVVAAESARAPVILSLAESHFNNFDFELAMSAVETAAHRAVVPVAIHLDHGANSDSAVKAIRLGCNGVMVDTTHLSLGENLEITRAVVKMAHACGVAAEGKLGYVPDVEEEEAERPHGVVSYTTPAEAKGFVERTGVDFLEVSIGTVHGQMNAKHKFDWSRLKEINAALGIPLVIRGGSGVTHEQFHKLITMGVAKINYNTALSDIAGDSIRAAAKSRAGGYSTLLAGVRAAVSSEVERCMRMWGSAGRAAEVMTQCRPWLNVERVVVYNASGLGGERLRVMEESQRQLSAIPGVREIQVGSVANKSTRYRHCWLIRFASTAVIESFNQHPVHVDFTDRLFRTAAADSLTADYLVASVEPDAIDFPFSCEVATPNTRPSLERVKI